MNFGFDFHGILDAYEVFRVLTNTLVEAGHKVHIITGEEDSPAFRKKLKALGISFNKVFSITSYHKRKGTPVRYDKNGEPWLSKKLWNKTKADYCKAQKIDLHIDDTEIYGDYFTTPFLFLKRPK
jgi:UDP:flavonoid glycosyltransferase YjiC (YdhE family)